MNAGIDSRDEAYCDKIKGLSNQEQYVYEWFRQNPDSTDEEIASLANLRLASVTGRRNSLMNNGHIKVLGKKYCTETDAWRTTYTISTGNEGVVKRTCLTTTEMDHMVRLAIKLNSFDDPFQKKKIMGILMNEE